MKTGDASERSMVNTPDLTSGAYFRKLEVGGVCTHPEVFCIFSAYITTKQRKYRAVTRNIYTSPAPGHRVIHCSKARLDAGVSEKRIDEAREREP